MVRMIPINTTMNNNHVYIGEALTSIDELKRQLERESSNMEKEFNLLVISLRKSLKQQKRDAKEITDCLLGINCKRQAFDGENQCVFRKKRKQLEECLTTDEIWRILQYYFSFFDFYLIELIAAELGTEDDQKGVDRYKKEFREYLKCRVFPLKVSSHTPSDDSKELFLKLDSSFDDCTLAYVEELREEVAKMLNLKPYVLRHHEIKSGCIQLVLLIPEFIFDDIFPLTSDQKFILQQLKVTRLDCGTFHFDLERENQNSKYNYCIYTCS